MEDKTHRQLGSEPITFHFFFFFFFLYIPGSNTSIARPSIHVRSRTSLNPLSSGKRMSRGGITLPPRIRPSFDYRCSFHVLASSTQIAAT